MPFRLHTRIDALFGLLAAATATVAILGASVLLFTDAGRTPWFEARSTAAKEAATCRNAGTVKAQHRCLRDVAKASERALKRDASLAHGDSFNLPMP